MRRSLVFATFFVTLSALCIGFVGRRSGPRVVRAAQATAPPVAPASPVAVKLSDPRGQEKEAVIADPATFAWKMFVFMNWPELPGHRGQPDSNRSIGAPTATVWESFKNINEVYLPGGRRPAAWETNDELPWAPLSKSRPTKADLQALGPVDSNWMHYLAEQVMIDGQQIVTEDANNPQESNIVQYDVRGNLDYFRYVVDNPSGHQLYNVDGQLDALNDKSFRFQFPRDTLEVKASWRILSPTEDASRYWTAIGVYYDNHRNFHISRIGLTGLHIISKVLPDWFWITFEQVDNATATFTYSLGKKGTAVGANINYSTSLDPVNDMWQKALAGTKWQYYRLMGTQDAFETPGKQPTLMGNTQMETYFQSSSSCISCHKLTSIGPAADLRLQFFYPLLPYEGAVDFDKVAQQQFPGKTFKEMDYAWSFRNAQFKKPAATH